jgi:hypothetical protein
VTAVVRRLGRVAYEPAWRAMQAFTDARDETTPDELWFLEHDPVFTQGLNGKAEHVLAPGAIPVVGIDRGGQVTYHGPGQLVMYALIDMRRLRIWWSHSRMRWLRLRPGTGSLPPGGATRPASTSVTGNSRASACASGAAAATMGSRST